MIFARRLGSSRSYWFQRMNLCFVVQSGLFLCHSDSSLIHFFLLGKGEWEAAFFPFSGVWKSNTLSQEPALEGFDEGKTSI